MFHYNSMRTRPGGVISTGAAKIWQKKLTGQIEKAELKLQGGPGGLKSVSSSLQ